MQSDKTACETLLDWWQRCRGARPMPTRAELDPIDLKSILPNLVLIEVKPGDAPGQHGFVFRLVGTEVDERFGARLTGLSLEQAPLGMARESIRKQYEETVAAARPVFCNHGIIVNEERFVEYDRVLVPLAGADGAGVVAIAGAIDFRCAYLLTRGRLLACAEHAYCKRIDLCLAAQVYDGC